jgi:anti-sigma B factor antagonist
MVCNLAITIIILLIIKVATMEIIDAEINGTTLQIVVKVARLDASTVRDFKNETQKIWNSKIDDVRVDLSEVTFLDSSGIGALLSLYKRLPPSNPGFKLQRVQPAVQAVIELLRLHRVFDVEA